MSTRHVAVIDDDDSARSALGRLLRAAGWYPVLFDSAERFLDGMRDHDWLCLIADVQLGGMSGIELQSKLRTEAVALPVIVITGNQSTSLKESAINAGCAAFLSKPFSGDAVLSLLTSLAAPPRT